jgi:hypothetical protein
MIEDLSLRTNSSGGAGQSNKSIATNFAKQRFHSSVIQENEEFCILETYFERQIICLEHV